MSGHELTDVTANEQKMLYCMLKSLHEVNRKDKYVSLEQYDENCISLIKVDGAWITLRRQEDEIIEKEFNNCVSMTIDVITDLTTGYKERKRVLNKCANKMTQFYTHQVVAEYLDNYSNKGLKRTR